MDQPHVSEETLTFDRFMPEQTARASVLRVITQHRNNSRRYTAHPLSLIVDSPQKPRQLQQGHSSQNAAARLSHDTLILSETQLLSSADASTLYFKRQEICAEHIV